MCVCVRESLPVHVYFYLQCSETFLHFTLNSRNVSQAVRWASFCGFFHASVPPLTQKVKTHTVIAQLCNESLVKTGIPQSRNNVFLG